VVSSEEERLRGEAAILFSIWLRFTAMGVGDLSKGGYDMNIRYNRYIDEEFEAESLSF